MNRTSLTLLAYAPLLLGLAGCAARNDAPDPFTSGPGGREQPVLLTVDNQDYRDATIYANWNGPKHRLGMVIGKTKQTFEMRWRSHDMWLEVDFVGGGEMKTGRTMTVWPGEHIEFIIMPGW